MTCNHCHSLIEFDTVDCVRCMAYQNYFKCSTVYYDPSEDEETTLLKFKAWVSSLMMEGKERIYREFLESSYYKLVYVSLNQNTVLTKHQIGA